MGTLISSWTDTTLEITLARVIPGSSTLQVRMSNLSRKSTGTVEQLVPNLKQPKASLWSNGKMDTTSLERAMEFGFLRSGGGAMTTTCQPVAQTRIPVVC